MKDPLDKCVWKATLDKETILALRGGFKDICFRTPECRNAHCEATFERLCSRKYGLDCVKNKPRESCGDCSGYNSNCTSYFSQEIFKTSS